MNATIHDFEAHARTRDTRQALVASRPARPAIPTHAEIRVTWTRRGPATSDDGALLTCRHFHSHLDYASPELVTSMIGASVETMTALMVDRGAEVTELEWTGRDITVLAALGHPSVWP